MMTKHKKSIHLEEADNGYVVSMYIPSEKGDEPGSEMRSVHESLEGAMGAMRGMMMGKGMKMKEQVGALKKKMK